MYTYSETQLNIIHKLTCAKLSAMTESVKTQFENYNIYSKLSFEDRFMEIITNYENALLNRRSVTLLKRAKIKSHKELNDITIDERRGFGTAIAQRINNLDWVKLGQITNTAVMGESGSGKTSLICAIGRWCISHGIAVRYYRASDLLTELCSDSYRDIKRLQNSLKQYRVLIIDDLGMDKASELASSRFFNLLDDRLDELPVIIGSQLTEDGIKHAFTGQAQQDAICRRIFQGGIQIVLHGDPESFAINSNTKASLPSVAPSAASTQTATVSKEIDHE